MDVFWPGYVAAEHKSRGSHLSAAMDQALDYLPTIPPEHLPRLVVVTDFARFRVLNQLTGEQVEFPITELAANLRVFPPMLDAEVHRYTTEEDVNLKATELLALLHDSLKASGYDGHPLRVLLVRLVFVMFADDTQVWEPGLFYDYLPRRRASGPGAVRRGPRQSGHRRCRSGRSPAAGRAQGRGTAPGPDSPRRWPAPALSASACAGFGRRLSTKKRSGSSTSPQAAKPRQSGLCVFRRDGPGSG